MILKVKQVNDKYFEKNKFHLFMNTEELHQSSQGFARTSRKMKRTYQWKNYKVNI
jgi:hypothetical protein